MPKPPVRVISESRVVRLWQQLMSVRTEFEDLNGQRLRVVYPGRPNDGRGGDFRDAIILSPRGLQTGCIEIHSLTSGWQTHGHHLDPFYNQVVLQVAWRADRGVPAICQNGRTIPTVLLEQRPVKKPAASPSGTGLACRDYVLRRGYGQLEEILTHSGQQRLVEKSRRFQEGLLNVHPGQALYLGLTQALGYVHNQKAFLDLAERTPLLNYQRDLGPAGLEDLNQIQSYLLGRAGLLPSQRGLNPSADDYSQGLEKIWRSAGWPALAPPPAWEFYRVRPGNYPVRRLMALSHWLRLGLFERWQANFLLPLLGESNRPPLPTLADNLRVEQPGYWSQHSDFGRSSPSTPIALVGPERAAEMIINVVLPFVLAWANLNDRPELAAQSISMYNRHPALAVNSIQRHMSAQLAFSSKSLNSACRQQGLLHIYKSRCMQGSCAECPLAD